MSRPHHDTGEPATAKRRHRKADAARAARPAESVDGPALRRHREIWYALLTMVVVTGLYALAYRQAGGFPKAWGLVGHGIGIVGFILILMTETLYSIRKRLTDAKWGSMASWLKFHIYTGLVGPYLVLLHTSMRFHGIAAVAMLFTIVVVASGIVGRYIYTSVPRTVYPVGALGGALAGGRLGRCRRRLRGGRRFHGGDERVGGGRPRQPLERRLRSRAAGSRPGGAARPPGELARRTRAAHLGARHDRAGARRRGPLLRHAGAVLEGEGPVVSKRKGS